MSYDINHATYLGNIVSLCTRESTDARCINAHSTSRRNSSSNHGTLINSARRDYLALSLTMRL